MHGIETGSFLTYQLGLRLLLAAAGPGGMFGGLKDNIPGVLGDPTTWCPAPPHVLTARCPWHSCIFTILCVPQTPGVPHLLTTQCPQHLSPAPCAPSPALPPGVPYIPATAPVATNRCPPCPQHLHEPTTPHPPAITLPATTPPPA